jgi:hypothetical protein
MNALLVLVESLIGTLLLSLIKTFFNNEKAM